MHSGFLKRMAIGLAGGSVLLLACVVHDDTNSAAPPEPVPADTTPPTRFAVDSGLVTLVGDGTEGIPGGGVAGGGASDAGTLPDSGAEVAPPDVAGIGSACDVFVTNSCGTLNGCYPNANGTGTCLRAGTLPATARCTGESLTPQCAPGLTCSPGFLCEPLCHLVQPVTGCEGSITPLCQKLGSSNTVGFCSD